MLLHLVELLLLLESALERALSVLEEAALALRQLCPLLDLALYFKKLVVCGRGIIAAVAVIAILV